jgi:hypothetical protein
MWANSKDAETQKSLDAAASRKELYNGFKDVELTPPAFIQHLIDRYEFLAVSLYELLRPIKEIGWQWWALSAVGLLGVSFVLQLPGFLSKVLQLRKVLATVIFIVWITLTLSLSSAIPVSNWEPDVQIRLKANLKEQVQYETNISLSQGLVSLAKKPSGHTNRITFVCAQYRQCDRGSQKGFQRTRQSRQGYRGWVTCNDKGTRSTRHRLHSYQRLAGGEFVATRIIQRRLRAA